MGLHSFTTRNLVLWQLHTMVRPSEAAAAEWAEIDLDAKLWTHPSVTDEKEAPAYSAAVS